MIFCIDSSLQLAQLSYKADFDLKNAVLRPYLAQIMRVSCVMASGWRGPTPSAHQPISPTHSYVNRLCPLLLAAPSGFEPLSDGSKPPALPLSYGAMSGGAGRIRTFHNTIISHAF